MSRCLGLCGGPGLAARGTVPSMVPSLQPFIISQSTVCTAMQARRLGAWPLARVSCRYSPSKHKEVCKYSPSKHKEVCKYSPSKHKEVCKVLYEDGDKEELSLEELQEILVDDGVGGGAGGGGGG
eukprot:SAG22_NODE_188_length_15821_cov_38.313319_8_plen_125_part_00